MSDRRMPGAAACRLGRHCLNYMTGVMIAALAIGGLIGLICLIFLDAPAAWTIGGAVAVLVLGGFGIRCAKLQLHLRKTPRTAQEFCQKGIAYNELLGDQDSAIVAFSQSIELDTGYKEPLIERAKLLHGRDLRAALLPAPVSQQGRKVHRFMNGGHGIS